MITESDYYNMRRKYFKLIRIDSDKWYQRYLDVHRRYWAQ